MNAYEAPDLSPISDPTRLAILRTLASRPLAVSELAKAFPVSRPAISQHLRILSDAGLVKAQSKGTQRIYAVDPSGLKALKAYYDQFWSTVLGGLKIAAEAQESPKSGSQRKEETNADSRSKRSPIKRNGKRSNEDPDR